MKPESYKARMDLIFEYQAHVRKMEEDLEKALGLDGCFMDKQWQFMDRMVKNLAEDLTEVSELKLEWILEDLGHTIYEAEFCTREMMTRDVFSITLEDHSYEWDLTLWNSWLSVLGIPAQEIELLQDTHEDLRWKIGEE
jgi:hypothetical protein